jgi:hypothetical protein
MVEKQKKHLLNGGEAGGFDVRNSDAEKSPDDADDARLWLAAFQLLDELKQRYADLPSRRLEFLAHAA